MSWARGRIARLRDLPPTWAIRLLALAARPRRPRAGVLIVPPTGTGSLGDDAMIMAAVTQLHAAGAGPVLVVERGRRPWPSVAPATLVRLPEWPARPLEHLRIVREVDGVLVIGADVLDGSYGPRQAITLVRWARLAATLRTPGAIVSTSCSESPVPAAMAALASLPPSIPVRARDPRSAERLRAATGRDIELVADLAFLLPATPPATGPGDDALRWIAARRAGGDQVIGLNLNPLVLGPAPTSAQVEQLLSTHLLTLRELLERRAVSALLIPHDLRHGELELARELGGRLARPDRLQVLEGDHRASEIKSIVGHLDLVLTGRMHLAIAAIGSGVPAACVSYLDKFEGLFDHLGIAPLTRRGTEVTHESLLDLVDGSLDRLDELRADIAAQLPRIRALSSTCLRTGDGPS